MKKTITLGIILLSLGLKSQISQLPVFTPQADQPQRNCGTGILPQQFEQWLQSLPPLNEPGKGNGGSTMSTFNIPVIVHIIHNNEAVNNATATTGGNLNAAQIIDQINILNKDFNGTNADTTLIPASFKPFHGKFQVNFCLAVVNPTGGILAEPGIDRINRVSKGWTAPPYSSTYYNSTIKPNSIWDPNRYFNIWVSGLSGGLLGYATFPDPGASGLAGLPAPYGNATNDGVVILNTAFGSVGTAAGYVPYNKGRTATHEVGHWIGLRHVWGDATCGSDYCNDTPQQSNATYNCPSYPNASGCAGAPSPPGRMFMNFMDYTNDACMMMFTKDQKYRAQLIMTNSPMRIALCTSTVCNLPTVGHDIGLNYVVSPTYSQVINCSNKITPVINLRNYGSTTITSAAVIYNVDGVNTQTANWSGSLNPGTATNYTLPQIINIVNGSHAFNATVTAPNGGTDNNTSNNSDSQLFSIANSFTLTANSASICSGQNATLTGSGGASSYSWNLGAIAGATANVSPVTTTIYTLSGTTGTCTNTFITSVTVYTTPTVTVNSFTICPGGSATLTAGGATSYSWSNGAVTNPIIVSPATTTVYTVTGNNNGCTSTKTSTVTIGTGLSVITTPSLQSKCIASSVTITASGAASYTWSNGPTSNSIVVSPTVNTIYTVLGSSGSCTGSNTAVVNISPAATVNVSSTNALCNGGTTGAATITPSGGAAPYTYSFSNGATTQTATGFGAGTFTAFVTTSLGCVSSKTFVVSQPSALTLSTNVAGTSCGSCNGSVTYTASGGTAGYTYTVSPGNNNSNLCSGNYTVTSTDANGCTFASAFNVAASSGVNAVVTTTNASCGACSDGAASVNVTGGTGPYTYTWQPSGGNAAVASGLSVGCYTVMITDAGGCTKTATTCVADNLSTGLQQLTASGVKIYPNPNQGNVTVEFGTDVERELVLTDVSGRIIAQKIVEGISVQIEMSAFSTGIYYLRVKDFSGIYTFKIVKQ